MLLSPRTRTHIKIVYFLLLVLSSCDNKYETNEINGITVKLDKDITERQRNNILEIIQSELKPTGSFYINNLRSITIDSVIYSYLMTVNPLDSIENSLSTLKSFGSYISKDILNDTPVNYHFDDTDLYFRHDTTTIIFSGYSVDSEVINTSSNTVNLTTLSLITRYISVQTNGIDYKDKLFAKVELDNDTFSIIFIIDDDKLNVNDLRETFINLDPGHKFIAFEYYPISIQFLDSKGNRLANELYIK